MSDASTSEQSASEWLEVWAEQNKLPETSREIGDGMVEAYKAGYAAACEVKRNQSQDDVAQLARMCNEVVAERARSAKLRVELQHIIDHEWTASPTSSSAWKWINHFVDGARKALAEYEAARD